MHPDRRVMLDGDSGSSSPSKRDATGARLDPSTRVSKSYRRNGPGQNCKSTSTSSSSGNYGGGGSGGYLTQAEQDRKFVADEDKFVLKQSKKKADIRVREGRARPIDFLAFNLKYIDDERDVFDDDEGDLDIDVPAPDKVVQELDEAGLTELDKEITSYHVLETNRKNRGYWKALRSLCATQKAKLNPQKNEERVVNSVAEDIDKILAPKTYDQLDALEKQIRAKLDSSEDIDTDYWEQLLRSLAVWKSKATLSKVFEEIAASREERLKARGDRGPVEGQAKKKPDHGGARNRNTSGSTALAQKNDSRTWPPNSSGTSGGASSSASSSRPPPGTERFSQIDNSDLSQVTNSMYDREVARGVSENEEVFTAEEAVPTTSRPQWADTYRPRRPRYFNRVQMGYEWNKYNQTHYDHDNPPPKVVQGYKFNIFYPELIDKTKAPTFKIIREGGRRRGESFAAAGEDDTCLIRFIAGPPYEDIAFRIVDREWDYSAKRERGFKSSFDKGILQLHFQFKKIFYRK